MLVISVQCDQGVCEESVSPQGKQYLTVPDTPKVCCVSNESDVQTAFAEFAVKACTFDSFPRGLQLLLHDNMLQRRSLKR